MALNNYSNLKAAIEDWSKRPDAASKIDDFITLTEEAMFSDPDFPLELRQIESRETATVSTSSRFLALPDRFLEMRRLKINLSGGDCDIIYLSPEQMPINGASGIPKFFTVTSQLEFDRVPDSAYTVEMQLYKAPQGLSSSNATNDVLTNHPSIYLHGCLHFLFKWSMQTDLAEYHEAKFMKAIRGATKKYKRGRYGPAPKIRIEGSTP